MKEFEALGKIKALLGTPGPLIKTGIGDDAAVLKPLSESLLVCSDAMVENIHFDLTYSRPSQLGHRAFAACLSDIAAMNGKPVCAVVSLALPKSLNEQFLEEFYLGAKNITQMFNCDIVGGDLTTSQNGIFIDVTCIGQTLSPIYRSGAKPGDLIAVSGTPGASAAGLAALKQGERIDAGKESQWRPLIEAHLLPLPRFDLLAQLNSGEKLCTSMIDISDGLSSELHHLATSSGYGFEIESAAVPLHPLASEFALKSAVQFPKNISRATDAALGWALSGGEDYELLVTLDPEKFAELKRNGAFHGLRDFTIIGRVVKNPGVRMRNASGTFDALAASGYEHL